MRIASEHLGLFVPARYSVPQMPIIGTDWPPMADSSGGLADFVGASFALPQNPVVPGLTGLADFVGGRFAVPQNPVVTGLEGLADFVGGRFAVPQNPILDAGIGDIVSTMPMYPLHENSVLEEAARLGMAGLGAGQDCGCGCNGHGACGSGLSGLTDDVGAFISDQMSKIAAGDMKTIAIWAGGALLIGMFLFGRSGTSRAGYRTAKATAREDRKIREATARKSYKEAIAAARAQYPTGAQRLGRATRAARAAF